MARVTSTVPLRSEDSLRSLHQADSSRETALSFDYICPHYMHAEYHVQSIDFRAKSRRLGSFHASPLSHLGRNAQISVSTNHDGDIKSVFAVVR